VLSAGRIVCLLATTASVGVLAGCGTTVDSGGLSAGDRHAAQAAFDALHGSNIPIQLVTISDNVQNAPAACRVRLTASHPTTFRVYVFWVPYLGSEPYIWLDMTVTKDPSHDRFHMQTQQPVLPGGVLAPDGRTVEPWSVDTTLLSLYGAEQKQKNRKILVAHAGNVFSKPGSSCQVLTNGDLRLVPAR
jgi:hypothetical protein